MSLLLAFYTGAAFEEVLLPAEDNVTVTIRLDRARYQLEEDLELHLEGVDGKWSVRRSQDYRLLRREEDCFGRALVPGDIVRLRPEGAGLVTMAVTGVEQSLEVFEKFSLEGLSEVTIGKAEQNVICVNSLGLVSAHHARLLRRGESWVLEDASTNGTYIGLERVSSGRVLRFGECINIFGVKIVFLGSMLAVSSRRPGVRIHREYLRPVRPALPRPPAAGREKKTHYFRRSPRNLPRVCEELLEIEAPPALRAREKRPLLLTIGPSFTMAIPMLLGCMLAIYGRGGSGGGVYMYTGLVTAVTSALLGVVWALLNLRYAARREREEKELRFEAYSQYLIRITDYLKEKQEYNAAVLRDAYPPAQACAAYDREEVRLWNRNPSHPDFLYVRVGQGDLPFQMDIRVQAQRFSLVSDPMAQRPETLKEQYRILRDVPVGVDLREHRLVGLVGRDLRGSFALARMLIVQLAATHCYTEVKLAFVGSRGGGPDLEGWAFARWLPHVWSEDRKLRFFARTREEGREVLYALSKLLRARAEERQEDGAAPLPHYVLFLDDPALLENEPAAQYILNPRPEYGLTTVLLAQRYEDLPNECTYMIQDDGACSAVYSVADPLDQRQEVRFDQLSAAQAETFARRLSAVRINERSNGGDIPAMLDFFDLMGVDALEELDVAGRWKKNRTYESLRAPVGRKAGGADCYLDVHEKYHGPHGLLAGTTGSGKSETLQTYILSLAVNFSPQDVAFLLIDFKGGGMANLFAKLPHTAGIISNLSGSQIRRAMVSIKSENLRRQRIFGEYGVNHIDAYTKLFKNREAGEPIPHLLIVIDEFAELKREEPDFMRELISVAQVGRSLGVHLILATQKPGGNVDDNIRSNTRFKLCLRVQDRQDSVEMLHKPDAAYITQVGRCYLQVGNDEVYELFQSAWSGARYDAEARRNRTETARMLDATGRAAMAGSRAEIRRKERQRLAWAALLAGYLQSAGRSLGLSPAAHPGGAEREKLLDEAVAALCAGAAPYADTRRNRVQLGKMLDLWPAQGDLESGKLAAALVRALEARGEKLPEWKEKSQLDAVVEYLAAQAVQTGCESRLRLWLPPLPEQLALEQLWGGSLPSAGSWPGEGAEWTLETAVGLCDAPESQLQPVLHVDFAANGHYALCGVVDSGKSTFLQTLLFGLVNRYSPDHLNIYALDFSAGKLSVFRDLPHVGGVMDGSDPERIRKFFGMLERMAQQRQKLLAGGGYRQYVKAHGKTLPAVLVVIDQYAAFREKTANAYDAVLLRLSSVGVSCGIYLCLTAGGFGAAEIPSRLAENLRATLCLEMGDKFKYGDVLRTMRFSTLPEANVKGRGLVNLGGSVLEFQTALPAPGEDDYQRSAAMEKRCQALAAAWTGRQAAPVPTIPEKPVWSQLRALEEFQTRIADDRSLPLGYREEDASVFAVDLSQTACYLVAGKARTGRTTALRLLMESAREKGGRLVVWDTPAGELKKQAQDLGAAYINSRKGLFQFWKDIKPEYERRSLDYKRPLTEKGLSDEEIFQAMGGLEKIYVFIHDLGAYLDDVYAPADPEAGIGVMSGLVENIWSKNKLYQIYFFAGFDADKTAQYTGRRAFNAFVGYHTGLLLGGEVDRQKLFSFDNLPYAERARAFKPGQALAAQADRPGQAERVVLPQWKG